MMHLETKAIGELLIGVLADYGAAYAGCGRTDELRVVRRTKAPAKERSASIRGPERYDALGDSWYCEV